jgi:hypothetical protein
MVEIRKLPAQKERVETGVVQSGDDWPGYFLRGDTAMYVANVLAAIPLPQGDEVGDKIARHFMQNFIEALKDVDVRRHR